MPATPSVKEPDAALAAMVDAVRAATRICRAVQVELVSATDAVQKEDRSPVTVADLASQAVVAARLRKAFPGVPLAGEEDSAVLAGEGRAAVRRAVLERVRQEWPSASERDVLASIDLGRHPGGAAGRFFTVDPVDGTKGFLRGQQYAVALALVEDGEVLAGVLGCPNLAGPRHSRGSVYFAWRGRGARSAGVTWSGLEGEPLVVSTRGEPRDLRLCESVEPGHSDQAFSQHLLERLGVEAAPVRMDSQAKYAVLARGDAELYLRTPTRPGRSEWIWDHAAGAIVLEEAGGRVTDLLGARLDFGQGRALTANRGVVATNGRLHDLVVEALAGPR